MSFKKISAKKRGKERIEKEVCPAPGGDLFFRLFEKGAGRSPSTEQRPLDVVAA